MQVMPVAATSKSLAQWETEGRDRQATSVNKAPDHENRVLGVSFSLLQMLSEEKDIPADWTMAQVCTEVIKPATLGYQRKGTENLPQGHCSYASLIQQATDNEGRPLVAKATQFLSYAWRYSWSVVFTALQEFERQQQAQGEPSYFFIESVP